MNTNDLSTLWFVMKQLRDDTRDPMLRNAIELMMLAINHQKNIAQHHDNEQPESA